jgi:hypothetical protein
MAIDSTIGGDNSNSYIDIEKANDYFLGRLYSDLWINADDTKKEQALRTATARIDMEKFYGDKQTAEQSLKFPRVDFGYLDGILIDGILPKTLLNATCELAIYLLSNDMSKPSVDMSGVQKFKAGSLSVDFVAPDKNDNVTIDNNELPPFVKYLLADFSKTVATSGLIDIGR